MVTRLDYQLESLHLLSLDCWPSCTLSRADPLLRKSLCALDIVPFLGQAEKSIPNNSNSDYHLEKQKHNNH
jgi:hypothetical protein